MFHEDQCIDAQVVNELTRDETCARAFTPSAHIYTPIFMTFFWCSINVLLTQILDYVKIQAFVEEIFHFL